MLNGTAYDAMTGHFFSTGKLWSTLLEVVLPHAAPALPDTMHSHEASCARSAAS